MESLGNLEQPVEQENNLVYKVGKCKIKEYWYLPTTIYSSHFKVYTN